MRRALVLAFVLLLVYPAAGAQPPLTPGAVVLLATSTDPSASDTLRRALADPNPDIRRAAARVASVSHPDVIDAITRALDREQDQGVVAEFVKDIMAIGGVHAAAVVEPYARKAGPDAVAAMAEWFARMDAPAFASRLAGWAEVRGVDRRLARIVRLAILCHPETRDAILQAWKPIASPKTYEYAAREPHDEEGESTLQTPPSLAAHLLRDTLAAAACPPEDSYIGAVMTFESDGRPHVIELPKEGVSAGCLAALAATARISTADEHDPVRHRHQVVMPMSPAFLDCAAEPVEEPLLPIQGFEGVRSPRLTKEVKPDYNRAAMDQRIEGIVELEGVVSKSGCVSSARVTRSLGILDLQALKAVLRWKFKAAQFGGRDIPMIVNVELTFTLRGKSPGPI